MKWEIEGPEEVSEPVVKWSLKIDRGGILGLLATDRNGSTFMVARVSTKGIEPVGSIGVDLGFAKDVNGAIRVLP